MKVLNGKLSTDRTSKTGLLASSTDAVQKKYGLLPTLVSSIDAVQTVRKIIPVVSFTNIS